MGPGWPERLWIVRHGESAGNVARALARAARLARLDLAERDVDVPLSERGQAQALALGRWFAALPAASRPEVVLTSPYVRTQRTAQLICQAAGLATRAPRRGVDERLREREFGVLDRLTGLGIRTLHPDQAELRRRIGKFYHRPPGGESWCDVILRLRSVLDSMRLDYAGRRVLIVTHQVAVLCLRYLLESLGEAELLAIDAEGEVANCGVTEYAFDPDAGPTPARLIRYNFVAPLEATGVPITAESDEPAAPR
ncbi:MAG: histidine phosphatase family protein [Caulobacteraceae bacterium]|nr:histidine phosphatase family protein [Caulobacteraceae bacterium]